MANVIKLRKGLDIHLTGKAKSVQVTPLKSKQYAVVPDSFTHGTSAQRLQWFKVGLTSGNPAQCNTF